MHVFLIPGFFGFANLGEFRYFAHVRTFLEEALAARGVEATLHDVRVRPTASLTLRTARLLEEIEQATGGDERSIHLVGHSSGGLDARLLVTPGIELPTSLAAEHYAKRVRSVVTVATPHRGTPLATLFSSMYGQHFLQLLSLATVYAIRHGDLPTTLAVRMVGLLVGPGSGRLSTGLVDQLYRELLADFTPERRQDIEAFFGDVAFDPSLMLQLRPEGMQLTNALAPDRDDVAYGCVVTGVARPRIRSLLDPRAGLRRRATRALFTALTVLTGSLPHRYGRVLLAEEQRALTSADEVLVHPATNDGIVPTRSQVWRHVIAGAAADHLDVIGHVTHRDGAQVHNDWLRSGAGFTLADFEAVWGAVADFVVAAE